MAMQVAYSAGTTSHSPRCSPRCSPVPRRKSPLPSPRSSPTTSRREWRPVMDGYRPPPGQRGSTQLHHNHVVTRNSDSNLKDSIPAMPKPVAIMCLIFNILFPGLGTFLSGTTVFCCSKVRPKGAKKIEVLKTNSWVALLQFLTAFVLLLGWIWSIMWGASFLSVSTEEDYLTDVDDDSESNFNSSESHSHRSGGPSNKSASKPNKMNMSKDSGPITADQAPLIVLQRVATIIKGQQSRDTVQQDSVMTHFETKQDRIMYKVIREDSDKSMALLQQSQNRLELQEIVVNQTSVSNVNKNETLPIISQKG